MQVACQAPTLHDRRIAAPSWVIPASLKDNCHFLCGKVAEAGLLFFDASASLAYGDADIPESLASLHLSYHVHLPQDLPWKKPEEAASVCMQLLTKTAYLADKPAQLAGTAGQIMPPHCRAVLHPPAHVADKPLLAARKLDAFAGALMRLGGDPALFFLENTRENDLSHLAGAALSAGFGFCPDVGHMLAFSQEHLLRNEGLLERAGILHLHAPGPGGTDAHRPLTELLPAQAELCAEFTRRVPSTCMLMLEHFRWEHVARSLPVLQSWLLPEARL